MSTLPSTAQPDPVVTNGRGPVTVDETNLDPPTRDALVAYLYALADDEVLLGHRDSEWTGLGPILEEDIAFSSMAQDELGHALVWYTLLGRLGLPDPDTLAFERDAAGWRNAQLVELPRGDYATSLVRQYLFDLAEAVRYAALATSTWLPMAEAAVKLRQEEKYHLIHGRIYIDRLCRAAPGSRDRLQAALDRLFPYALGLWEPAPGEEKLAALGIVTAAASLQEQWLGALVPFLEGVGLSVPVARPDAPLQPYRPTVAPVLGGRRGEHLPELTDLLAAMQGMYRSDPEAVW